LLGDGGFAGQFGVGADQRELVGGGRGVEHGHHRAMQGLDAGEGPLIEGALHDPGRQLEGEAQGGGEAGLVHAVQPSQGQGRCAAHAVTS
jgi:hypothetical protein